MNKHNCNSYFCYECQCDQKEEVMQKYDCTICDGRKCETHSIIDKDIECKKCDTKDSCVDCLSFEKCCEKKIHINESLQKNI